MTDILGVLEAEREIRRLLDQYCLEWDLMDADHVCSAEFFAPDGALVERGVFGDRGRADGVDQIVEWHRQRMLSPKPRGLHTRMNYIIDVEPTLRRASVIGTFIYVLHDQHGFKVGASGRYEDMVEKDDNGRWWIHEHKVSLFPTEATPV